MIAILRAPELSATSRIDRIWIMTHAPRSSFSVRRASFVRRTSNQEPRTTSSLDFDRFPHDPRERPPLAAAHRAGLDDGDHVAGLRFVLLVVDHELRRAPLGLAVQAVPHLPLDGYDAALLHRVAHDHADFLRLFCHRNTHGRDGRDRQDRREPPPAFPAPPAYPALFCRSTVLTLARSRRTVRSLSGFSSCPIDFWMRMRNS